MPESQTRELGEDTVWRPREGILSVGSEARVVLLGPESGQPIVLEGVAVAIWRAVQNHGSCDDLVLQVIEEFDVTAAVAGADVAAFLHALCDHGLVETVSARGGS